MSVIRNFLSIPRAAVIRPQRIAVSLRANMGKLGEIEFQELIYILIIYQMFHSYALSLSLSLALFLMHYSYSHIGEPFPCYYSRAYPEVVIGRYSWENNLYHLVLSLIIPNVLFAISIGVLSYWYCPCCDKACNKSSRVYAEKFPSKEE